MRFNYAVDCSDYGMTPLVRQTANEVIIEFIGDQSSIKIILNRNQGAKLWSAFAREVHETLEQQSINEIREAAKRFIGEVNSFDKSINYGDHKYSVHMTVPEMRALVQAIKNAP